jgi:hypothetical protein
LDQLKKDHFRDGRQTRDEIKGVGRMNMGSANTREGDMGRPRIDSNQIPTTHSLYNSIDNSIHTNQVEGLTETNVDESSEERSMRTQQDQ